MESMKDLARAKSQELKDRENTIKLIGADPMSERGFTQVPNFILTNSDLSVGAKLTYAMLLKYAWEKNYSFPGQQQLAKDMGISDRSVRTHLNELATKNFIKVTQRGLGKVNVYSLRLRVKKQS